jgi:hypothetical protein
MLVIIIRWFTYVVARLGSLRPSGRLKNHNKGRTEEQRTTEIETKKDPFIILSPKTLIAHPFSHAAAANKCAGYGMTLCHVNQGQELQCSNIM